MAALSWSFQATRVLGAWIATAHSRLTPDDSWPRGFGSQTGGYGYVPVDTVTEGVYLSGVRPLKETDEAD